MYTIPLQTSMNAILTMVGVPRRVPTLKAPSCAAVEVDSSLQAMDWTVMVWLCYWVFGGGGGKKEGGRGKGKGGIESTRHTKYCIKLQILHLIWCILFPFRHQ